MSKIMSQLKDQIYDLLYVFHVNFGHNMHHSEDTAQRSFHFKSEFTSKTILLVLVSP